MRKFMGFAVLAVVVAASAAVLHQKNREFVLASAERQVLRDAVGDDGEVVEGFASQAHAQAANAKTEASQGREKSRFGPAIMNDYISEVMAAPCEKLVVLAFDDAGRLIYRDESENARHGGTFRGTDMRRIWAAALSSGKLAKSFPKNLGLDESKQSTEDALRQLPESLCQEPAYKYRQEHKRKVILEADRSGRSSCRACAAGGDEGCFALACKAAHGNYEGARNSCSCSGNAMNPYPDDCVSGHEVFSRHAAETDERVCVGE